MKYRVRVGPKSPRRAWTLGVEIDAPTKRKARSLALRAVANMTAMHGDLRIYRVEVPIQ